MTDLHLVVGGLLTRDPMLGTLLLDHAAGLQWEQLTVPSSIVPSWAADDRPGASAGGELLTVEAHVSRSATWAPAPVAVGVLGPATAGYCPSGATSSSR